MSDLSSGLACSHALVAQMCRLTIDIIAGSLHTLVARRWLAASWLPYLVVACWRLCSSQDRPSIMEGVTQGSRLAHVRVWRSRLTRCTSCIQT